jgi:hypothetical protein
MGTIKRRKTKTGAGDLPNGCKSIVTVVEEEKWF